MNKKLVWIIIFIVICSITIFLSVNKHLFSVIKNGQSDIDDYKIFENAIVEKGDFVEWELAKNYNKKEISDDLLSLIKDNQTVAFLVIQDGEIRYEKYFNDYTKDSLVNSFSMAKTIVSLLIGIAIDEGKIESVDQKVSDFLPEFSQNVTIKDVLTMSSGLNWSEKFNNPLSDVVKAYYTDNLEKLLYPCEIEQTPGVNWKYQCGNTLILSFILEKVTGQKINEYASSRLWKKLGTEHNALWSMDKESGNIKSFCCFFSTARDFAKLGELFLEEGYFDNKYIISKSYLTDASTPADYLTNEGKKVDNYGYQMWITEYESYKIPYFRGIHGQYIYIIPGKNAVVVRLGERKTEKNPNNSSETELYLKAAMQILY